MQKGSCSTSHAKSCKISCKEVRSSEERRKQTAPLLLPVGGCSNRVHLGVVPLKLPAAVVRRRRMGLGWRRMRRRRHRVRLRRWWVRRRRHRVRLGWRRMRRRRHRVRLRWWWMRRRRRAPEAAVHHVHHHVRGLRVRDGIAEHASHAERGRELGRRHGGGALSLDSSSRDRRRPPRALIDRCRWKGTCVDGAPIAD